tara:strand:+ start:101 stop:412 length:312 start_codon:yes stop_codon:yes gene_type:complete
MGDLVDLDAFRKQKIAEQEEEERKKLEADDAEKLETMQIILSSIITQLGDPQKTGTLFYVPMTDDDYFNYYQFDSGYNDDGYYESTWEWEGLEEDSLYEPEED